MFLGVVVPEQRKVAKRFRDLTLTQIRSLLKDRYHECRLTGLLILVLKFERASEGEREEIVAFYLEHLDHVNNWDLVDSSADKILGRWLLDKDRDILYTLADSDHLWRQRVSMIATYAFIKERDFSDTIALAEKLRDHPHDLIHKAVAWVLREIGNRDLKVGGAFLKEHATRMPRTMLRYAIEKFPEALHEGEGQVKNVRWQEPSVRG